MVVKVGEEYRQTKRQIVVVWTCLHTTTNKGNQLLASCLVNASVCIGAD